MSRKLNVIEIVKCHVSTFVDVDGKRMPMDYAVFFGVPIILMVLSSMFGFNASDKYIDTIVTASSIFIGLLLNMLLLINNQKKSTPGVDSMNQDEDTVNKLSTRHALLQETFYNISYCIVISIVLVFISMSYFVIDFNIVRDIYIFNIDINYKRHVLSPISIFLITNLLLSILMVVKRVYSLLKD